MIAFVPELAGDHLAFGSDGMPVFRMIDVLRISEVRPEPNALRPIYNLIKLL